jgi:nitrite reductase/ring-hydroxylating ferredoxin subunit/Fe-S cluster biogenesis protein NfuA
MSAVASHEISQDAAGLLAELAGDVALIESIGEAWPAEQRATLERLRIAIEVLHREALLRLVRGLREDPAAAAQLARVVRDPLVFGVLRLHGLVRDPLEVRVRDALESVEPFLAQHGGGVELVAVKPPDTVEVRLTGACQGCPASGQTLREGVERAIRERAPEIAHVVALRGPVDTKSIPLHFVSPFARASDAGFVDVCALDDLVPGGTAVHEVGGREVLLYRGDDQVSCVDNVCAHMGMPLDGGEIADGVIECPYHAFRYRLDTGECLSVPEVQLVVHAVRVRDGRVAVKPSR